MQVPAHTVVDYIVVGAGSAGSVIAIWGLPRPLLKLP